MTISLIGSELRKVPQGVELLGLVAYGRGSEERYIFRFPSSVEGQISRDGNPWLVLLLPLAVTLAEALRIPLPVDPVLLANARKVMETWESWEPRLRPVPIEAEVGCVQAASLGRSGQFFTAGIDSFFTTVKFESETNTNIDDFIFVHGFDIPLDNQHAWKAASKNVLRISEALGKDCILFATNLRATRWGETRWPELSHGAAIIGSGLALESRYDQLIIPASWNDADLRPWGSHPNVDTLFSTQKTAVIHFGNQWRRTERTMWVASSNLRGLALAHLRVCSNDVGGQNCCRCGKCLRTMATLELLGVLAEATAFPDRRKMLDRIAHLYIDENERVLMGMIREDARLLGREDVSSAIDAALLYTQAIDRRYHIPQLRVLGFHIKQRFPRIWRLALPLRSFVKSLINPTESTSSRKERDAVD
jgi:hypothetical protein